MSRNVETLFQGLRFSVVRKQLKSSSGVQVVREIIEHPGSVTILPILEGDRVCLIKNQRPAVASTLIELPAGTLESGETPLQTARRELAEETGWQAGSWKQLHAFYLSPGILNEHMFLFMATDLSPGPPAREAGEHIENLILSWQEALTMADDGRIHDAKTLLGLFCGERYRNLH